MSVVLLVDNIVKTRLCWWTEGQLGETVLHYRASSVGSPAATDVDFAKTVETLVYADAKGLVSDKVIWCGVGCQIIYPTPVFAEVNNTDHAGQGTTGTANLPTQTSGLIGWQTARAGRAFRGRSYIPFPSSDFDTGTGAPALDYLEALNALAIILRGPINIAESGRTATMVPVIWHRVSKIGDGILTYAVRSKWATQRRRGQYGRLNPQPF